MGRKNNIEGQLSLFDMAFMNTDASTGNEPVEEKTAGFEKESPENIQTGIEPKAEPKEESKKEKVRKMPQKATSAAGSFQECQGCWCLTCEHSSIGGGKPRPFGEVQRVCPACEMCVQEGQADVCVIGSAEEGCRFRAEKEGLVDYET